MLNVLEVSLARTPSAQQAANSLATASGEETATALAQGPSHSQILHTTCKHQNVFFCNILMQLL